MPPPISPTPDTRPDNDHRQFVAVRRLTNGPDRHGFDWAELERHRLLLGDIAVVAKPDEPLTLTADHIEAIAGIVNGLDWLTDLAHAAGMLQRAPKPE